MTQELFSPLRLGALTLAHRVLMAPLTRMRAAHSGNVPHALNLEYHCQRTSQGGLSVSEGTQISANGPGIAAFGLAQGMNLPASVLAGTCLHASTPCSTAGTATLAY